MDAPESPVNRIGRTIWTVWGYLSGAVARYLRPEVTDEGNQRVCSRSDQIDLSAANKINREEKANSSEKEEDKSSHNDKSTGEVKCSLAKVKVQVASVQWEKTDVVKDDKNDELNVDTARKQTYSCARWSAETDHEGSISGDSESRECKIGTHIEKEAVSSDEGQAESVHANSKASEIIQELDETGRIEQKDGNNEEYDQKYEDENCSKKREDPDDADVTVQSELYGQDVEQEKEIIMDHGEKESSGGFEQAGFIDEMEKETVGPKERVEIEIDEDQGPELQVPGDAFEEEADGLSNTERLKVIEKYCDEIAEFCKNEVEEMIPENRGATDSEQDRIKLQESWDTESDTHVENVEVSSNEVQAERGHADIECKESEMALELDKTGQIEQKDDNDEDRDQNHGDEKCEMMREDPDHADVTVQSELYGQDVEQEKEIMMDHGETESSGGFEHAGFIDEMEIETVGPKEIEIDEDQGPELQVPADAFEEEADGLSNTERLKVRERYDDEIVEFCKNEVEGMIPENRGATESEQDTIKSELQESAETLQTVSKEKNILNIETELKMTVNTSEDSLQFDSKQDTPENTSETGTGLPVVMAITTEGMFSYPIVCEFPGESRKRPETALGCFEEIKSEPQSLAEKQPEKETFVTRSVEHAETPKAVEEAVEIEQDIETPIESVSTIESQTHQEIDNTKFSLKKHVEFKTELIVETTETKICSEDEEAEPYETQSQSSNIRNVTLQTRELLEFTERERKSSPEAMDTFSESLGNSGVSEITGTAEIQHVVEDQTDAKPVLIKTLSPGEFLEETLDLQGESEKCIEEQETRDTDVAKIALEYVEEIMNQVLKDMIEVENNLVKETETLEGVSTEELGDVEFQGPEECVSVGAFVLEEERKLLGETMGSIIEVETTSREVAIQNEQDIISQECKTTEADQQRYLCAGTDHGGSSSWDTHVENEDVSSDEVQAERVYANSKDSEIVQELDETGRLEQKDGNNEEYDQKYEDENCSKKREDPDHADVTVQSELYGQDVEQEKEIMMDHGETESSGGFEQAGFIDEMEKETVGLKERLETEIDEDQGPELQVPGDAYKEEADGLSNPERLKVMEKHCDEIAEFCKNEVEEVIPENRGAAVSEGTIKLQESWDTHVENVEVSSSEVQAERGHADIECKESETALELDKTGQIEQKDDNDEDRDQNHEDEKCQMKSEDPDVTVQSELYRQDVEQEKEIMMDHGETESSGGLRHAGEHLVDQKNIVDQNDHEKAEIDEDQGPELQVPADAFVLEEGRKLLGETMEVENASREAVKHIEPQSSPECETKEADGRHDQIHESSGHEDFMEVSRPGMKRRFDRVNKDPPVVKIEGTFDLDLQAFEDSSLDFSVQKSRIAVKNPLVRPPKDPRKLLFKISVEPRLPQPPACEVSAPSKGVIGFKLPGLGAGLPALRKTEFGKKAREEGEAERTLHPQLKSVAVTEDSVKREPASAKPKWTPPKHPGMGTPLMMAELRNKLKKPVKE